MRVLTSAALVAGLGLVATAAPATAQEPGMGMEQCTAELTPKTVKATGVQSVLVRLSEEIGEVTALEAPTESALWLATPEEIQMTQMSSEEEPTEPAEMTEDGYFTHVWLNTKGGTPGIYTVQLQGESGTCRAEITITGAGN